LFASSVPFLRLEKGEGVGLSLSKRYEVGLGAIENAKLNGHKQNPNLLNLS